MMGNDYGWMMGPEGYAWMMGGASTVPQWMRGQPLPKFMMGSNTDVGQVMGRLFANEPGPRVASAEATVSGNDLPVGATIDRAASQIVFRTMNINLSVLASPANGPEETFRAAGMVNPTVVVPHGAKVTIELINADNNTAHGLVVSTPDAPTSMPMLTSAPAFSDSALWFLGESTSAGMHDGTLSFIASTAGTYQYLCPVPGHVQKDMHGGFVVNS